MNRGVLTDLPYIHAYTDRHGRRRLYYRRKGHPRAPLPGLPGSPEFMAAYNAAAARDARVPPSKSPAAGTFGALCHEYEHSSEFAAYAELTQRETRYVIRKLEAKHSDKPVNLLAREHILRWRDDMKKKPGAANKMLRTLKVLLTFARDRNYCKSNEAHGIKLLRGGEYRAWTREEMLAFEAKWPLGTLERTGYALALYTGQRRADVAKLTFKSIAGGAIRLVQGKTAAAVEIPLHPELRKAIAAVHPRHEAAILARKSGRALNPIYFGHRMAAAIAAAGLPDKCVLHGLRKSAAVALIDAGCTPHQAAAVTGHKTARMLEAYAKNRDQAKLGKAAMLKWGRTTRQRG